MATYFAQLTPTVADHFPQLTKTERDVLRLLAEGLQNAQIAERLFLAPKTVRNNVSSILTKLNVAGSCNPCHEAGSPFVTPLWNGATTASFDVMRTNLLRALPNAVRISNLFASGSQRSHSGWGRRSRRRPASSAAPVAISARSASRS